eukprot:SAG22_NODE_5923_length_930_cov_1.413959_1_plen_87_part_00
MCPLRAATNWLVNVATLCLFLVMHAITEVPFEDDVWRYLIYDLVLICVAAIELLTQAVVPLICCGEAMHYHRQDPPATRVNTHTML